MSTFLLVCSVNEKITYKLSDVLKFTIPLLLSALSMNLMFSVDRIVLAYYSVDSMTAASIAGSFMALIHFMFISIAQIAVIFVGQYNGSKDYQKIAQPVWQMVYFCLFSCAFLLPIAYWTEYFCFVPDCYFKEASQYQRIMMSFSWLPPLNAAFSSFFIGRCEGKVVSIVVVTSNLLNLLLDVILIFGVDNLLQPMGTRGAAIATVVSEFVYLFILLSIFFNKNNRKMCNTLDIKFRKSLFLQCLKTGFPISLSKCFTFAAWYIMFLCFSYASKDLATIESVLMSMFVIFIFFADGASKAISSMSANLIGSAKYGEIHTLFLLFMKLNFFTCLSFAVPLVFYQDLLFYFIDNAQGNITHLYSEFSFVFYSLWILIFTDGIFYIICGILSSGGDTKFPMYIEILSSWMFGAIPAIIMYYTGTLTTVMVMYTLIPIGCILNAIICYKRYKTGIWMKKLV